MKNLLFMAMMILGSMLFVATGASAQYCSTFLPSCHWQESAGLKAQQATEERGAVTSGEQQKSGEFYATVPATEDRADQMAPAAVSGERELKEMTPAGSTHSVEYGTTGKGHHETPSPSF